MKNTPSEILGLTQNELAYEAYVKARCQGQAATHPEDQKECDELRAKLKNDILFTNEAIPAQKLEILFMNFEATLIEANDSLENFDARKKDNARRLLAPSTTRKVMLLLETWKLLNREHPARCAEINAMMAARWGRMQEIIFSEKNTAHLRRLARNFMNLQPCCEHFRPNQGMELE